MPTEPDIILGIKPAHIATPQELQAQSLENQQRQQQVQGNALDLQEKQRTAVDRARIRSVLTQANGDIGKALPAIMQINPELGMGLQKSAAEASSHALNYQILDLQHQQAKREYAASQLAGIDSQQKLDAAHMTMQALGEDASQLPDLWDDATTPKVIEGIRQRAMTLKEQTAAKEKALDDQRRQAAQDRADLEEQRKVKADAEKARSDAAKEAAAAARQATIDANTAEDNRRQLELGRGRLSVEQQNANTAAARLKKEAADVTELTPAGLDAAALNYAKTGQLPPLGMGDKTTRKAIINRAAELGSGTGEPLRTTLDLASARAGFQADEGSLKKLQASRDAISAFETTAVKNIDLFLNTAGKVVDTGSPMANALARGVSGKMLGSPDQAAYDAARQVALNEVAKIVSNPNLSGTLSDSARKEIEAFNPNSATLKQSVAVMRVLKQDMANRAKSYDDQIAQIRGRISGKGAPATADKIIVTAPDGSKHPFDTQAQADAFKKLAGIK